MTSTTNNIALFSTNNPTKLVPIDAEFKAAIKVVLLETVERLNLGNCAVMLRGIVHTEQTYLVLDDHLTGLELDTLDSESEFIISTELPIATKTERFASHESISIPVDFGDQRIGYIIAATRLLASQHLEHDLQHVFTEITGLVRRYQTRYQMLATYGDQPYWIGASRPLRQLDQLIDKLAQVTMPVVIRGDKGTGKVIAARALHCHATSGFAPFIESSCEDWSADAVERILAELWSYAKGGTLFLRNIDLLSPANFNTLQNFWADRLAEQPPQSVVRPEKFIVTLSSNNPVLTPAQHLLKTWLEFDCLELRLPSLRERYADIRSLCHHFIQEYHLDIAFDFNEDAWRLLETFSWPENVQQLQKLIQKLAILVDSPCVNTSLLLQLFPSLETANAFEKASNVVALPLPLSNDNNPPYEENIPTLTNIKAIFGGARSTQWEHPSLLSAVKYTLAHHAKNLTLDEVAANTGTSAPALSELLIHRLGLSFTQLVAKIRIENAKALLQTKQSAHIEQVCSDVGFSDFNNFETTFKRMVGLSPQIYRAQFFSAASLIQQ